MTIPPVEVRKWRSCWFISDNTRRVKGLNDEDCVFCDKETGCCNLEGENGFIYRGTYEPHDYNKMECIYNLRAAEIIEAINNGLIP